jgi:CRISPR-associated protein Csm5
MKVKIETLSPLHIGNGEKYDKLSFIQDGEKIYIVDFERIKRVLNKREEIENFTNWVLQEVKSRTTLTDFFRNKTYYISKLKETAIYWVKNYTKKQLSEIECFIKQNYKVYIPGSEIKGSIRTALWHGLLKREYTPEFLEELKKVCEEENKKFKKSLIELGRKFENKLFRIRSKGDGKYDLLKFLCISDSNSKDPSECLFVSEIKILNTNRSIYQELLKKGETFTCDINLQNKEKILNLFGYTNTQKKIISNIKEIFHTCYEWTNQLIDAELAYDYPPTIKEKLKNIKEKNKPESPVIRIGKNQGFLSVTIGLFIKEKDKNLFEKFLSRVTSTSYRREFPKTRRVIVMDKNDLDTSGWIKLTCLEDSR